MTSLFTRPLQLAEWIPQTSALTLARSVCEQALSKVGTWEDGGAANRGKLIDEWNQRAGVPLGSAWCASFVSAMWEDGGQGEIPPRILRSNCDEWLKWAHQTGRFRNAPEYGAAILYGIPGDASHIELVVRLTPKVCVVGGNTSMTGFSREGVAVDFKEAALNRKLGYVSLLPAT